MNSYYSLGFSQEEKNELIQILANYPKWINRINSSYGFFTSLPEVKKHGDGFQYCAVCGKRSSNSGITENYYWLCPLHDDSVGRPKLIVSG